MMRRLPNLFDGALAAYQRTLSPDHGWWRRCFPAGWCRFSPSCSAYGRQAIRRHGARRGLLLALGRLGRCHPWNPGGYDPVPEKFQIPSTKYQINPKHQIPNSKRLVNWNL